MRHYERSEKRGDKPENEDFKLNVKTQQHGHLFIVLDFASNNYPNASLKYPSEIKRLITSLDALPGMTDELFLAYLGKDINNYVYGLRQKVPNLACVAAMCIFNKNRMSYFSYGDVRINIYTREKLILLNGAKYMTPTVIEAIQDHPETFNDDPPAFGLHYFDSPLTERVRSVTIKDTDIVLIFSDGMEEAISPQRRLDDLRRTKSDDPQILGDALIQATSSAQDDRTVVVIGGPYDKYVDPEVESISSTVSNLGGRLEKVENNQAHLSELQNEVRNIRKDLVDAVSKSSSSIEEIRGSLKAKADDQLVIDLVVKESQALRASILEEVRQNQESKSADGKRAAKGAGNQGGRLAAKEFETLLHGWIAEHPDQWRFLITSAGTAESTPATSLPVKAGITDIVTTEDKESQREKEQVALEQDSMSITGANSTVFSDVGGDQLRAQLVKGLMLGIMIGVMSFAFGLFVRWFLSPEESWRVKSEQSRFILIHRTDGRDAALNIELPRGVLLNTPAERTFQSFDEAQAYIENTLSESVKKTETVRPTPEGTQDLEVLEDAVVQPGDSINSIARRYNTTDEKLRELNRNVDWDKLQAGTKIKVPHAPNRPQ